MAERNAFTVLCAKRPREEVQAPKPAKKNKNPITMSDSDDPLTKILSWRHSFNTFPQPPQHTYIVRKTPSIVHDDESAWGSHFQGIFIDIDWSTHSIEHLKQINLHDSLMDNGIVFIWLSHHQTGAIIDYFNSKGFQYVENFIFVLLDRQKISLHKKVNSQNSLLNFIKKTPKENQEQKVQEKKLSPDFQTGRVKDPRTIFMNQQSQYFLDSQKVLFLFRKQNKNQPLQLRHQRTSDAFFTIGNDPKLDWKSKQVVYKMIETLLIKANYEKGKPLKLLELWGNENMPRKGWVSVCEQSKKFINDN